MNAESLHKLLARQLRRHFGSLEAVPPDLVPFLAVVDRAYQQADDDRALMEHSLETVSQELADRLERMQTAIGEREQVQKAFAQVQATIESTTDGVLVLDLDGAVQRANQAVLTMWEAHDPTQPNGVAKDLCERLSGALETPRDFRAFLQQAPSINHGIHREELRTRNGRVIEWHTAPQRLAGVTIGWVWSFRDISERLLLQEQLRQSQKMQAIGQLAGGIAHDFNNLLTVIDGNLELAITTADVPAHVLELLSEIATATSRAAQLTSQLLAFSRKQTLRTSVFDLASTIEGLTLMLRRTIGPRIALHASMHPAHVRADRTQLDQVLLNLVINARDAMGGEGTLRVHCRTRHVDHAVETVQGDVLPPGSYASLSVSDTGPGIPLAIRDQIFEPFFTTKAPGEGTGLGLSMVYGLVRQSGGYVILDSREGHGTTIEILLPSHAPSAPTPSPMKPVIPASEGITRTVLVVDDEDAVRRLVCAVLERQGYLVHNAPNGRDALDFLDRARPRLDLVVSDVVMPEMGGRELARRLRTVRPEVPVLFMSGYSHEEMADHGGQLDEGMTLLAKPFSVGDLLSAVRGMMD